MLASSAKKPLSIAPYLILAFFIVLTLLLGGFIWIAVRGYPGEVTQNAYNKGLRYNSYIEQVQAQDKLGWHSDAQFATHDLDVNTVFILADKNGTPITNAVIYAWFVRAAHQGGDVKIPLISEDKGIYSGQATLAWKGEWEAHISATSGGQNYQLVRTLYLK